MSIALVQSALGGSASATIGAGVTNIDATGNFSLTTGAGNLLVFIVYSRQTINSGFGGFGSFGFSGITSGLTWVNKVNGGYQGASTPGGVRTTTQIFLCPNAASISSATITTVRNGFFVPAATNITVAHEFSLYEFSGVNTATNTTTGGALVDLSAALSNQTSSVPNIGSVTTTKSDLVIVSFIGDSGVAVAGASYSLGQSMAVVTRGQAQYQLNSAVGSIATAFASGSQGNWGGCTVGLKPTTSIGNSSYGFFFGD